MASKPQPASAELQLVTASDWHGWNIGQNVTELDACSVAFRDHEAASKLGWQLSKPDTFWRICALLWPRREGATVFVEANPWGERVIKAACEHRLLAAAGCASCVSGDTRMLNPITGESPTIQSLCESGTRPTVATLNGPVLADVPYLKGESELFEFRLSSGSVFKCTSEHRLLTPAGWRFAREVSEGHAVIGYEQDLPGSSLDAYLSGQQPNEPHCSGKVVDSQSRCFPFSRPGDGLLLLARAASLYDAPSRGDAPRRSEYASGRQDDLGCKSGRSHPGQRDAPSRHNAEVRISRSETLSSPHYGEGTASPESLLSQQREQFHSRSCHPHTFSGPNPDSEHKQKFWGVASCGLKVSLHRVVSIRSVGVEKFYDLNVPVEHHYFAEGAIHHNSGKSFLLGAAWALVNWWVDIFGTKIIITSQTVQGARNRVWKDICQLFRAAMGVGMDKLNPAVRLLDATAQIKTDPKRLAILAKGLNVAGLGISGMGIEIVAGGKGEASSVVGKLQGLKAKRMFLILDEMPLLEHGILEAGIGNLAANKHSQVIGLGNFSSIYDPFGVFTEPVDGWKSLHDDIEGWQTKPLGQRGYCLRFDGEKSPNVLLGYDLYPGIYSNELHRTHKLMGVKSPMYWKMCRSMPMPEGGDLSIYSEADFVAGDVHGTVLWDQGAEPVGCAFLDPAFTNGGDRSSVTFAKCGQSGGRKVIQFTEYTELKSDVTQTWVPHDFQIARQWRDLCQARGIRPEHAGYDRTGAGMSFGSIVASEWSPRVIGIDFGGSASDRPVSLTDSTTGSERYENRVAELWVQGREYVRSGQIKGMPQEMAKELLARQFPDPKNGRSYKKTAIESKREMKKRIGYSPDIADSGLGCVEVACQAFGFVPHGYGAVGLTEIGGSETALKDADSVFDESCLLQEFVDHNEE